jgi:ArsR family transcriptional regulator
VNVNFRAFQHRRFAVIESKALTAKTLGYDFTVATPMKIDDLPDEALDAMLDNATAATNFLKAIGHEGRLMILCHLANGEKSVTELEELLSARQAAVSQQLGRLRLEGLVTPRRDGKTIYYSLADERCKRIIGVVYDLFCR